MDTSFQVPQNKPPPLGFASQTGSSFIVVISPTRYMPIIREIATCAMNTKKGTITRANTYARENGVENVAVNYTDNSGQEHVAHLPWSRFQGAGIMLPEQLVGTSIEVTYLSKGDKTLNGSICDKDDTLVSSFIADAMIESAEAFGSEIRKSLVDQKAKEVLQSMNTQQELRAKSRLARLKALKAGSSAPETTDEAKAKAEAEAKAGAKPGLDKVGP